MGEKQTVAAAIDPRKWLKGHQAKAMKGGGMRSPFLAMGLEAIEASGGDVMTALSDSPDLRAEILMAHLLTDNETGDFVRHKILALAKAMDRSA